MSANMSELVNRIPQDKMGEILSSFTKDTTAQQVLDSLGAAGVEATEEEAQALLKSLHLSGGKHKLSRDELEEVAGGEERQVEWYYSELCDPCKS